MAIAVDCACGKRFKVKDELAGKKIRCPQCKEPLRIPGGPATSAGARSPAAGKSSAAAPPKVDAQAAILKFEQAQKRKAMSSEAEAAYREEQKKLIESYEEQTGKSGGGNGEGDKEKKKKKSLEFKPKRATFLTKIADAIATIFANRLVRYILLCAVVGAGVIGSVKLFQYIGHYSAVATNTMSNEDRVAKLMADAERLAAQGRGKRDELKKTLDEISRIRPDFELRDRRFQSLSKKLKDMY